MKIVRQVSLGAAVAAAVAMTAPFTRAATPQGAPQLSGGTPHIAPPPGAVVFKEQCSACHTPAGMDMGGRVVPTVGSLRTYPPERIYDALTVGKMQAQGAALTDKQKREVSSWLAGRQLVDAAGTDVKAMKTGVCPAGHSLRAQAPRWSGWGNAPDNRRFQSAAAAGLSAEQVPQLTLKWAFGVPASANVYSQPAVAWGRVFFGADNAAVYAVDAESGCAYWSFHADAGVRTAPIPYEIDVGGAKRPALIFTSILGTAFAVDAQAGTLIWKAAPPRGSTRMTGSATYADGKLFLPFTGTETVSGAQAGYPCCTSRGSLVALDANTGKLLWRSETIAEKSTEIGRNAEGKPIFGSSGASIWNAPTVDVKRGLVYVGTGNSFGPVAAKTSDAILAYRISDGELVWHHQEFENDSFMLGCPQTSPAGGACPTKLGPDWDFGGSSVILQTLADGRDVLLAAGKGGIAIGLDPDKDGALLWRTPLFGDRPPTADGLVIFGGAADSSRVYYPLQRPGGGLTALDPATGKIQWTGKIDSDPRGQIGPASAIPGVIFTGAWDGGLRALDAQGKVLWRFDTARPFKTVNGIEAHGGSLGQAGAAIAGGRVFISSGYVGMQGGSAGNVILAFGL